MTYRTGTSARGSSRTGATGGGSGSWAGGTSSLSDGDVGGPAAVVTLRGDNLVVVCTHLETGSSPSAEVVASGDGAGCTVRLADRPVLVEGGRALNGRLVDTLVEIDVVDRAIGSDGSLVGATG